VIARRSTCLTSHTLHALLNYTDTTIHRTRTNARTSSTIIYIIALFVWLISRICSANEQYFSLITNQRTILSVMTYQLSEQGKYPQQTGRATNQSPIQSISITHRRVATVVVHTHRLINHLFFCESSIN